MFRQKSTNEIHPRKGNVGWILQPTASHFLCVGRGTLLQRTSKTTGPTAEEGRFVNIGINVVGM